jgi:hypothetical protein
MNISITLLAFGTCFIFACNSGPSANKSNDATATPDTGLNIQTPANVALDVQPLSNYFIKNNDQITDSLTFLFINDKATFDGLFGMAKTMNNEIIVPDFGTHVVVAATMPATFYNTQIQLLSATSDSDNNAEMHFIAVEGNKQSSSIKPLWLGMIPKTGMQKISFYTGDHLSKTVTTQQ